MVRWIAVAVASLVMLAAVGSYAMRRSWVWMPLNPSYTLPELKGLTVAEVKAKLGTPDYDPSTSTADHQWIESRDGPFALGYYGAYGATCTIWFAQGKVVDVKRFSK